MQTITGLVAVVLVFLSGPYHSLQIRWPHIWGRRLPTWAHANVSLAATAAVFIHVIPGIGYGLTWIGTWLFLVTVLSGLYGMYVAIGAERRKTWLTYQRWLSYAFYATIISHVVGTLLGFAAIAAVAISWAVWRWRAPMRERLVTSNWPYTRDSVRRG